MSGIDRIIKTLPKAEKTKNSAKSKKAKVNSKAFKTDFLMFRAKTAFLYLQTIFTKVQSLYHFDLKNHIRIKTDASEYVIGKIFSYLTLNQNFSGHVIDENPNFFKFS